MIASSGEEEGKCSVGGTSSGSSSSAGTSRSLVSDGQETNGEGRSVGLRICSMGGFLNCALYMAQASQYSQCGGSEMCGCIRGGPFQNRSPDVDCR